MVVPIVPTPKLELDKLFGTVKTFITEQGSTLVALFCASLTIGFIFDGETRKVAFAFAAFFGFLSLASIFRASRSLFLAHVAKKTAASEQAEAEREQAKQTTEAVRERLSRVLMLDEKAALWLICAEEMHRFVAFAGPNDIPFGRGLRGLMTKGVIRLVYKDSRHKTGEEHHSLLCEVTDREETYRLLKLDPDRFRPEGAEELTEDEFRIVAVGAMKVEGGCMTDEAHSNIDPLYPPLDDSGMPELKHGVLPPLEDLPDLPTGGYVYDPPYLEMRLRMLLTGTNAPTDRQWAAALRRLLDHLNQPEQAHLQRTRDYPGDGIGQEDASS